MVRRSLCGPVACWIFAQTSSLVTWSFYEMCSILRWHLIPCHFVLKGTPTEDTSWPENRKYANIFICWFSSHSCSVNIYETDLFFLLQIWTLQCTAVLVHSSSVKSRKSLAHDTVATSGTCQPCSWCPQREAGDVWCLPPVWNLRAVIWFHFAIFSLVLLPSPVTLSVLSFSACWPFLLNFFQKILQYFTLRDRLFCMAPV